MLYESMLKYSNDVLIKDAITAIFKTHLRAYELEDFTDDDVNYLVKRFSNIYKDYIIDSFKELDIQTITIEGKSYIMMEELMAKISNVLASKLAIEIILLELKSKVE